MQKLIEGVHRFQGEEFGRYRKLFKKLSREGQKPHTLFITCADSRVVAELVTQSKPGDLFVLKNIGNIVPPAGAPGPNSTGAAIEFAVSVLQVEDIVVCGHSQCGAIEALVGGACDKKAMPHLCGWLEVAAPVRKILQQHYSHLTQSEELITAAAEENVLFSLENLHTYQGVEDGLKKGTLRIHGWFFKIATGELFAYDIESKQFSPIQRSEAD